MGAFGVRVEMGIEPLITAERAARIAAGRTGRRVSGVPELVNPRFGGMLARWRVPLETPVVVLGFRSGETDTLSFVMVGRDWDSEPLDESPKALRPLFRATMAERTDSLDNEGIDPLMLFTIRLGMPRTIEPFYLASGSLSPALPRTP